MQVTPEMIAELSSALIKDQMTLKPSFRLSNFKREGAATVLNDKATERNASFSRIKHEGISLQSLFQQIAEAYSQLGASDAFLIEYSLGEHAWLAPYLPLFSSEVLQNIIQKHYTEYLYTDEYEIYLQSIIVLMLAHHSNPNLLATNQVEFEILANTWLQTLLTFNDVKKPELRGHIDGWHDNGYCSTKRNINFMQFCAEAYYKASKPFADLLKMPKWVDRVVAFEALNNVLVKVMMNCDKFESHDFVDGVRLIQNLKAHQISITDTSAVATIVESSQLNDDTTVAATVISDSHIETQFAIAETEEAIQMREDGMRLIQEGLRNLSMYADSSRQYPTDHSEDPAQNCVIS